MEHIIKNTYKENPSGWEQVWQLAVKNNTWRLLKPCPYLMVRWQKIYEKNPKTMRDIASYNSCNIGIHKWCTNDTHCGDGNKYTGMELTKWNEIISKYQNRLSTT